MNLVKALSIRVRMKKVFCLTLLIFLVCSCATRGQISCIVKDVSPKGLQQHLEVELRTTNGVAVNPKALLVFANGATYEVGLFPITKDDTYIINLLIPFNFAPADTKLRVNEEKSGKSYDFPLI